MGREGVHGTFPSVYGDAIPGLAGRSAPVLGHSDQQYPSGYAGPGLRHPSKALGGDPESAPSPWCSYAADPHALRAIPSLPHCFPLPFAVMTRLMTRLSRPGG